MDFLLLTIEQECSLTKDREWVDIDKHHWSYLDSKIGLLATITHYLNEDFCFVIYDKQGNICATGEDFGTIEKLKGIVEVIYEAWFE